MQIFHPAPLSVVTLIALLLASMCRMRGVVMVWSAVAQLVALLLDLITARRPTVGAKELEIFVELDVRFVADADVDRQADMAVRLGFGDK